MNIVKMNELKTYKDQYILEYINGFVITNDDYIGITILDSDLNIVKNLLLFDDIIIYHVYKHFLMNELLLYCPENSCIVWINLEDFSYKIVSSINIINFDIVFSPLYFWENDVCIFTTYSSEFYILDTAKATIKKVSSEFIEQNYIELYKFLKKTIEHLPCYPLFNLDNNMIININKNNALLWINDVTQVKSLVDYDYHDIAYMNHIIGFIGEFGIQIVDIKSVIDDNVLLFPEKKYHFLRARFYNDNGIIKLVTLSAGLQKRQSLITTYQINLE